MNTRLQIKIAFFIGFFIIIIYCFRVNKWPNTIIDHKNVKVKSKDDKPPSAFEIVILIQTHDRVFYLSKLLESLKNIPEIDKTLVIISSDVSNQQMSSVINVASKFYKILRINYTFPYEQYRDVYPHIINSDCLPLDSNCLSKLENREGSELRYIKHHWWWKINHIFKNQAKYNIVNLPIILLEEDHFVGYDLITTALHLYKNKQQLCLECVLISLGIHGDFFSPNSKISKFQYHISPFVSSSHNMGIVVDHQFYKFLLTHANEFCNYNDYNWDWTLHHLSLSFENALMTMALSYPRVIHLGGWGVHSRGSMNYVLNERAYRLLIEEKNNYLSHAPQTRPNPSMNTWELLFKRHSAFWPMLNGNWKDPRDIKLCMMEMNL